MNIPFISLRNLSALASRQQLAPPRGFSPPALPRELPRRRFTWDLSSIGYFLARACSPLPSLWSRIDVRQLITIAARPGTSWATGEAFNRVLHKQADCGELWSPVRMPGKTVFHRTSPSQDRHVSNVRSDSSEAGLCRSDSSCKPTLPSPISSRSCLSKSFLKSHVCLRPGHRLIPFVA